MSIHRVDITFSDGSPKIIEVRQGPKGPSGDSSPEGVLAALDAMGAGQQAQARGHIGAASASDVSLLAIDVGNQIAKDSAANNYGTVVTLTGSRTLLSGDIGNTIDLAGFDLTMATGFVTAGDSVAIKGTGNVIIGGTPAPLDGSATLVLRYYATGWEAFSVSSAGVTSYNDLTDLPTLGSAAALDVGTTIGTVAAGNHTHSEYVEIGSLVDGSIESLVVNSNPLTLGSDFVGLFATHNNANTEWGAAVLALGNGTSSFGIYASRQNGVFDGYFGQISTGPLDVSGGSNWVAFKDGVIHFGTIGRLSRPASGDFDWTLPSADGTIALTSDLTGLTEYATAAQGALADTALQPTVATKTTPVDADTLEIQDSAASGARKLLSFANLKTWLQSWIDAITAIAGAKTFSGQMQLTGQAATDANSAMTRGLSDARYGGQHWFIKGAKTTVNNSTTLVNSQLVSETLAVGTYVIDFMIDIENGTSNGPGQKLKPNFTGTATGDFNFSPDTGNFTALGATVTQATSYGWRRVGKGYIVVTAPGVFAWQFAQNTANASDTDFLALSWMEIHKVA